MTKLTGEFIKDVAWIHIHPKEVIEYIQKLEAQIVDNHDRLGKEIDRLERLLSQQLTNPLKKQREDSGSGNVIWDNYTTTGTLYFYQPTTTGGTIDENTYV